MPQKSKICAVVVTHNRKEKLDRCLQCILNQHDSYCDIVVVDNDSSDGTNEMIKTQYESTRISYYNTGKNLGSAGGFNFGIKVAVLLGYKYLWIMDDDVYPDSTALRELVKAGLSIKDNWGCLSSVSYWNDGSICKPNRQKKGLFTFVSDIELKKNRIIPVKIVSFSSMYVKTVAVHDVGLPIKDYFFYTDDYEFSERISEKYGVYVVTSSRVLHDISKNTKASIVSDPPEKMYRYNTLYRNDVAFYSRFGIKGICYLVLKTIYTLLNILLFEKKDKASKAVIVLKGIKEGIGFRPKIEMVDQAKR